MVQPSGCQAEIFQKARKAHVVGRGAPLQGGVDGKSVVVPLIVVCKEELMVSGRSIRPIIVVSLQGQVVVIHWL